MTDCMFSTFDLMAPTPANLLSGKALLYMQENDVTILSRLYERLDPTSLRCYPLALAGRSYACCLSEVTQVGESMSILASIYLLN